MRTVLVWKHRLQRVSNYTSAIVVSLFLLLALEFALASTIGYSFGMAQVILFSSLISFFSLMRAILSLNTDLTSGNKMKWKLLLNFTFWSVLSFVAGFYASMSAVRLIDQTVFPIVSFLAYVWKSYLLLFVTSTNFIGAIFAFHRIANAVQIDTIEWFKRGFGADGDPPRANLSPVAKKLLVGLIAQLALNIAIYAYGSPEAFFSGLTDAIREVLSLVGISLPVL